MVERRQALEELGEGGLVADVADFAGDVGGGEGGQGGVDGGLRGGDDGDEGAALEERFGGAVADAGGSGVSGMKKTKE